MAKSSTEVYSAAGKTNVLRFDPETLHLVTDEKSPLYDERVHAEPNERMVLNIMAKGVRVPIIIWKNPETGLTEVVDGRQRVINAREANRRLIAQGEPPVEVQGVVHRSTSANGADLADVMVLTNELREQDTHTNRARKMQRLADLGRDEEAIALVFGVTAQTIRSTLALLEAPVAERQAVDAGQITLAQSKQLAKLPIEKRRTKVAELTAAAEGAAPRERAAKQRAILGEAVPKMRTRKQIETRRDAYAWGTDQRELLNWVLGLA